MRGCLRSIISLIILVFAFIGFKSIGGVDYVKGLIDSYLNPPSQKTQIEAQKIANFSKVPKNYEILKALDIFGVKAVVANERKTDQKMVFADPGWAFKLSKNDIRSNNIDEQLKNIASKFAIQPIKVKNLEIEKKGNFEALNQTIPYVKVKVYLSGSPYKNLEGIIGVANMEDNKNKLVISLNEPGKYSEQVAEKFFKSIKPDS